MACVCHRNIQLPATADVSNLQAAYKDGGAQRSWSPSALYIFPSMHCLDGESPLVSDHTPLRCLAVLTVTMPRQGSESRRMDIR